MSYPGYVRIPYPKWVEHSDGVRRIVQNREQHELAVGRPVNEDGTLVEEELPPPPDAVVVKTGAPPTLETVIAAGYKPEVAAKIVAEEQFKFNAGYPPYGTTPVIPLPPDAAHPPTQQEREEMFAPEVVQPVRIEEPQPAVAAPEGAIPEASKAVGDNW